jgi:hypothetical protein
MASNSRAMAWRGSQSRARILRRCSACAAATLGSGQVAHSREANTQNTLLAMGAAGVYIYTNSYIQATLTVGDLT